MRGTVGITVSSGPGGCQFFQLRLNLFKFALKTHNAILCSTRNAPIPRVAVVHGNTIDHGGQSKAQGDEH